MHNKEIFTGGFTLPGEAGEDRLTLEFLEKWTADAIRDSDGTKLSEEIVSTGYKIYSTICLVRADQEFAKQHPHFLPQKFLISEAVTAFDQSITINLLNGYSSHKYKIDTTHSAKDWWQVFNRTTGEEVKQEEWAFDSNNGNVKIINCKYGHIYTVNFLVYQIWDSTSMYNHLTNGWEGEHIISVDPYYPEVREHLLNYFDKWITEHPNTDIVRLTTLAYHFTIDSKEDGSDKYRDWTGYTDTVSIPALLDFEKEHGYCMTSEDFVDKGYFNATHCPPKKHYIDWIKFIHKFVVKFGKELVNNIHNAGKRAAIFQGDHWIGVEPYSPGYSEMGIDINIGACESGVSLRRVADSPWDEVKEIRLYPYFFSDMYDNGRNPAEECINEWMKIRRALLRNPVDRIGYGGYISIAAQIPELVNNITAIRTEFSEIIKYGNGLPCKTYPVKVGVLTSWGKLRSWINHFGRDQKFIQKRIDIITVAGSDLLENLAGLPVEVSFFSFDDIKSNGIPDNINVIINDGEAGSAWSGGEVWRDPDIIAAIRCFVAKGGGFIGSQAPSACNYNGHFFQLFDLLGIDKEMGATVTGLPPEYNYVDSHFILSDIKQFLNFDNNKSFVYPIDNKVEILHSTGMHINISANSYKAGRSVYLSSLPYSMVNSRLLLRAILWSAGKESVLYDFFSDNFNTDCAVGKNCKKAAVINNSNLKQTTSLFIKGEKIKDIKLIPYECKWIDL